MTDIVRRLRAYYEKRELPTWGEIDEAADEIERLRAITQQDPRGPFFLTQWEREDYERRQRGEPELGPGGGK